jgi:hypothetical protein
VFCENHSAPALITPVYAAASPFVEPMSGITPPAAPGG